MAKQYRIPPNTVYPATVADYRKAKAGKLGEVDWTKPNEEELVIRAPYSEIVSSWLANGIEEVAKESAPRTFGKDNAIDEGKEVND